MGGAPWANQEIANHQEIFKNTGKAYAHEERKDFSLKKRVSFNDQALSLKKPKSVAPPP